MAVEWVSIRSHQVARDDTLTHRWFDAVGPSVVKYELNTAGCPTDDTTGMPTDFTYTLVNASTFTLTDVAGGAALFTAAGAENDGVTLQLGAELAGSGESVSFAAEYPTYFGITFQMSDVDQSDLLTGFCITDTTLLGGMTDGMYFRTVDGDATLYFVLEKDSTESANAVGTLTDATDVVAEVFYWGSNVYVYIDGVLQLTVADTDANFPNDELLRLSFEFLDGEAVGNTATVRRWRFAQIQA